MRKDLTVDELGRLLEQPLLAVLATYRRDGSVLLSPVWHEWDGSAFVVATGSGNVKTQHVRRDPRASIVVCEHVPPYRGIEVHGRARLVAEDAAETGRRIAIRYLGETEGTAKAEAYGDDVLIRIEPGFVRAWDFADEYGA